MRHVRQALAPPAAQDLLLAGSALLRIDHGTDHFIVVRLFVRIIWRHCQLIDPVRIPLFIILDQDCLHASKGIAQTLVSLGRREFLILKVHVVVDICRAAHHISRINVYPQIRVLFKKEQEIKGISRYFFLFLIGGFSFVRIQIRRPQKIFQRITKLTAAVLEVDYGVSLDLAETAVQFFVILFDKIEIAVLLAGLRIKQGVEPVKIDPSHPEVPPHNIIFMNTVYRIFWRYWGVFANFPPLICPIFPGAQIAPLRRVRAACRARKKRFQRITPLKPLSVFNFLCPLSGPHSYQALFDHPHYSNTDAGTDHRNYNASERAGTIDPDHVQHEISHKSAHNTENDITEH